MLLGAALLAAGFGLFPQEPLRQSLERMLQDATSERSRLGSVRIVPLLLRASVQDLRVEVAGIRLFVPHGEVEVSPRTFSEGAIFLSSLELVAPRLELEAAPFLSAPAPPGKEPAPFPPIRIDRLAVREGVARWHDPSIGTLEIAPLAASGSVGVRALDVVAPAMRWTAGGEETLGSARARLALTPLLDGTLEHSEVRLGRSRLSARGPLLRRAAVSLGLDLQGSLDLADAGRLSGQPELAGELSLQGRVDGANGALRAEGHVHGRAAYGEWRAEALDARGSWDAPARSGAVRLTSSVLGGSLEADATLAEGETRGQVGLRRLDLARLPSSFSPSVRDGQADAVLSWNGPLDGDLRLKASVETRVEGTAGHGQLRLESEGTVRPRTREVDLAWTAHVEAQSLASSLSPAVSLDARGAAIGPLPPRLEGTLDGQATFLAVGEREIASAVAGSFLVDGDQVQADLDARGEAGSARAEIEIRGDRLVSLFVHGAALDLGLLAPEATGTLDVDARASGTLAAPSVDLDATARDLTWQGQSLGALDLHAEGDSRALSVRGRLPDLSIETDGTLALDKELRLRGQTRLRATPIGALAAYLPEYTTLCGQVTATVDHDVPLARPAASDVRVDFGDMEAQYGIRTVRVAPFELTLRDGTLAVEGLRVDTEGVAVSARGSATLEGSGPLDVDATVDADLHSLPVPEGWTLTGTTRTRIHAAGSRDRPQVDGEVGLANVTLRGPTLPDIVVDEARLALTDRGLVIPGVVAHVGGGRATADGDVPWPAVFSALRDGVLEPEERASVSLRWEDVTVDALGGTLAGELTVVGGLAALDEPVVVLTLPQTRLRLEGVPVEVAPATVRLDAGRLTTTDLRIGSGGGHLVVTGGADLAKKTVDVVGTGDVALAVLSPLLSEAAVSGGARIDVAVTGSLEDPRPSGTLQVTGASIRLRTLPQALTNLDGRVDFSRESARVEATGRMGGGTLEVAGEVQMEGGAPGDLWLQLTGREVAVRYPVGLRSRFDVDLTLAGRLGDFTLAGDVAVQRGVYELEEALGAALRTAAPASAESEILRGVALDVRVKLDGPVLVRSSFGDLEATGQITARGDLQQPAPFGRLSVRKGGKFNIQGREFTITDGSLTYAGDWNAAVVLRGEAVIAPVDEPSGDYTVRVSLEGSMESPTLSLTSDPNLAQQQIASLIATGRTGSTGVDTSAWLLGGQAASLVSGQLTRRVASSFGLDEITVRPDLVAGETDPSARFTFGKRFGRHLRVIYSAGLGGPETRFVQVEGRPGFDIAVQAQRRDSGENAVGAGQRFEWGAAERERRSEEGRVALADVRIESEQPLDEDVRASVRLRPGRRVLDWQVQDAAERLRERLRRRLHLQAEVAARLEGDVAVLSVSPGPVYGWRVEGLANPPDLDPVLREALFEADALDLGRQRLLLTLWSRGHLRAEVTATATDEQEGKRLLVFAAVPGIRYDTVDVRFPGADSIPRSVLLDAMGGAAGLLERPEAAQAALREAYRSRHFLEAKVETPRVVESADAVQIVVDVAEGPPARLAEVRFDGATLPEPDLRDAVKMKTGEVFEETMAAQAIVRLRGFYLSRGYTDARIRPELVPRDADVVLVFHVVEGQPHTIDTIALHGNDRTRDSLVRRAMDLESGSPVDPRRLAEAERRLMNLGVFSRAAIVPQPDAPSSLTVELQEGANLGTGYNLRWDEGQGASVQVDGEARNLFGFGPTLGARYRYGGSYQEARGWFFLPAALTGGDVTASVFRSEQEISIEDLTITRLQKGFQVQQSFRLPHRFEVYAGYRFRRNTTLSSFLPPDPIDIGGVDLSLLRNTRDDLLDPLEGSFLSFNLEVAPSFLGSDAPLLKGYAQVALAHTFAGGALTWAQSYRLGVATGFGEPLLPAERFNAGGANSLRGFATNEVGPRGPLGDPAGGDAVVILNQELRYRYRWGLGGVVFYDGGNVFETVSELGFDIRHTLGLGLRWTSPVGLLRVDFGFPLDRQPEEKSYRIFFSLGQAF